MPDRIISTHFPVKIDSVAAAEEQEIATEPGQSIRSIYNSSNVPGHADVDADDALSARAQKNPRAYLKHFQKAEFDQNFLDNVLLSDKNKHLSATLTRKVQLRDKSGLFILHSLLGADNSKKGYRWYYSAHNPETNNATFNLIYTSKPPRKELTAEERELLPAKIQEILDLTPKEIKRLPAKRQSEVQKMLAQVRPHMQIVDADQRKQLPDAVQSALTPLENPPIYSLGADKGSCMMFSCEWFIQITAEAPGTATDRVKHLKTLGRQIAQLQKVYLSYGDNDGRNDEVPDTQNEATRAMLSKNLENKRQQHKNAEENLWELEYHYNRLKNEYNETRLKPFGADTKISAQLHQVTVARKELERAASEYDDLAKKYSSHIHASKTRKQIRAQVTDNQTEENKNSRKKILQLIGLELTSEHKTNIDTFHDLLKTLPIDQGALLGFDAIDSLGGGGDAMVLFRQHAGSNGLDTNSGKDKVRVFDPNFGEYLVPLEEIKHFLKVLIKLYKDDYDKHFELEELLTIKKSRDETGNILAVQKKKENNPLNTQQLKTLYGNNDRS